MAKTIEVFTLTEDEFISLSNDDAGYCLACREEAYGVEPDARRIECECCGKRAVYGVQELLFMGLVQIEGDEG